MFMAGIILLVYGILTVAGGVLGWVKKNSTPSLIAGGLSGILLIAAGALLLLGQPIGAWMGAVVALLLIVVFLIRLARGAGPMPAVPMILLSLVGLAAAAWVLWSRAGGPTPV